jgi:tRNA(His) 5'-end guanylyltransferase
MKDYERLFTSQRVMPQLPTFCRIDGKAFHSWTSDLRRPYDERLSKLFVDTTRFLLEETGAKIGYTQSDEITLCWHFEDYKSQLFFDGKIHKLNSVIASLATGYFNVRLQTNELYYIDKDGMQQKRDIAFFDCRTWQVPNLDEATNVFLWREQDATRNSISMAAQSVYSHKELHGKNTKEMQEMLHKQGINWNDYPNFFKKGTYLTRQKEDHTEGYSKDDNMTIERTVIKELEIPPLKSIANRVGALFEGEAPIDKGEYITAKNYVIDCEVVEEWSHWTT